MIKTYQSRGSGNLHVDQTASTSSVYHSGYWSSPVSTTVGVNYAINDVLKDGTIPTILARALWLIMDAIPIVASL